MSSIESRAENGRGHVKSGYPEFTAALRDVTERLHESDIAALKEHMEALCTVMSFSVVLLSSLLPKTADEPESKGGSISIVESRSVHSAELDRIVRQRPTGEGTEESGKLTFDQIVELSIYFLSETADELARKRVSFPHGEEPDVESIGGMEPGLVGAEESARHLSERTLRGDEGQLLNSGEMAERLGLKTRQSVHNWLHQGRIVGWKGAKRSYVFPAGQINDRGMPVDGLEQVVPFFGDGYAAWIWLTTPLSSLDGMDPLTLLSQGKCDRVVTAAAGDMLGDFD